jgi:hypothetical protein
LTLLIKKGLTKVFVRFNTTGGDSGWIMTEVSAWKFHPFDETVDVAMVPFAHIPGFDYSSIGDGYFFTSTAAAEHEITLGMTCSFLAFQTSSRKKTKHPYRARRQFGGP